MRKSDAIDIPAKHEPPQSFSAKTEPVILIALLLGLLTIALYWPTIRNGFINFDDPDYVLNNPRVQAGLTADSIRWAFTSYHSSNWHPLTWMSHMLDCEIFGLKPGGHHLSSAFIHAANSVLLFLFLFWLTSRAWAAAFVAALFAFHPLHVESVAWVSERKDLLCGFFFILTLWAYAAYARSRAEPGTRKPAIYYGLALFCFALGLMSKPMLVTVPFLLLLLDYWPLRRLSVAKQPSASPLSPALSTPGTDSASTKSERAELNSQLPSPAKQPTNSQLSTLNSQLPISTLLLEKLPFFLLAAGSSFVTFIVQRASGATVAFSQVPLELRLGNALLSYGRYLAKTFWPVDLAMFYPFTNISALPVISATVLLLTITGVVVYLARRKPYLPVGWFWFTGMLVPVIGIVQVGKQAFADRYTYLPHIGLFILVAWVAADLLKNLRWPRTINVLSGVIVLGLCGLLTARQIPYWQNSKTLSEHATAVTERNYVAHAVLATALVQEGKLDEALEHCLTALEMSPGYSEAHNTLGAIYARQGKHEEAAANFRLAISGDNRFAEAYTGLGGVLNQQGKYAEAETMLRQALQLAPISGAAHYNLAISLHKQNKLDEAAFHYKQAIQVEPSLFAAWRYLGNILAAQGKGAEAAVHFKRALKLRPDDSDTRTVLGMVLLEQGEVDQARIQLKEAVRIAPTNAIACYQLALVEQASGNIQEAVSLYRAAAASNPDWPEPLNNLAWIMAAGTEPSLRDGKEAVILAERACALTENKFAVFIGTLAAAYAEAGRFNEAITTAERARDVALAIGQKEIADRNEMLLTLYRAGKPARE